MKKCTCQDSEREKWKFHYYRKLLPRELAVSVDAELRDSASPKLGLQASLSPQGVPREGEASTAENSVGSSTWRSRRRTRGTAAATGLPGPEHHNCKVYAPSLEMAP